MKRASLVILLTLMLVLTLGAASAEVCVPADGTYCGTLEGTYTSPALSDQVFKLKADIVVDHDSQLIRITNIDTSGSDPAIDDSSLNVVAMYKSTGLIEVIATGTCGPMGYPFYGEMQINPCDFSILYSAGYVRIPIPNTSDFTQIDTIGDFALIMEECEPQIPVDGTYCGTLEGTYTSPALSDQVFKLKADIVADHDSQLIRITNIDTSGSDPAIDDSSLNVVATYKSTGLIEVIATGSCGPMGYPFYGEMLIDPSDFSILSSVGYVRVPALDQLFNEIPLTGDFTLVMEECEEQIPEFPTVALPMIAIVGLAFVIQRRKD